MAYTGSYCSTIIILYCSLLSYGYSCNFTNKAISHTSKVELNIKPKLCPFGGCVAKAKGFLSKQCRPGYLAGSYGKIFIAVTKISVAKTRGNRSGLKYEHIAIFTKKGVAR